MDVKKTIQEVSEGMAELGAGIPDVMQGFEEVHKAVIKDGALSAKEKELMCLAIAIAVRCSYCIAFHVADALKAGATREEIEETIGTAILMGGGPAVAYGTEALDILNQLSENN